MPFLFTGLWRESGLQGGKAAIKSSHQKKTIPIGQGQWG
jgi:hypothetical protein